jgi:hypothetical protein
VHDLRLFHIQNKTPQLQSCHQPSSHVPCLFLAGAEHQLVISISHQCRGVRSYPADMSFGRVIPNAHCFFHPMKSNIEQHGTNSPTLRSSLLRGRVPSLFDHSRLQPTPDHFSTGK